jgi:hypothetical protein
MSLLILCFLAAGLYAAPSKSTPKAGATPQTEEGGRGPVSLGVVKGPGTEANIFDDNSLIYTPVPTVTPVFTIKTPEIEAWGLLVDTKSLLNRCAKDTKRYTKTFKKDFMEGYNDMGQVVSRIHTEALLDKRDQVELDWENQVDKAEHSLALAEEWGTEFNEDYKAMVKNQARVKVLLKRFSKKIQRTNEVELKYGYNDEEMFYIRKDIDKFNELFKNYVFKYQAMIKTKEDKVNKLLNDHYELYKP